MNAAQGGANLLPGVNLHQGANCAYKRGLSFSDLFSKVN